MKDHFGREIDYLRISITDRCNLRCSYCMPVGVELVGCKDILSFEEITTICAQAAGLGIKKIKITGGEPLVRKGCCDLIRAIKEIQGIEQVTLTTNGVLLKQYLPALQEAGIDGINISLDTLQKDMFQKITGFDMLSQVLEGITLSVQSGIKTKVNVVLQQGKNDHEMMSLAELAKEQKVDIRFIEMMPIGYGASSKGVSNEDVLQKICEKYPRVTPDGTCHGNGPAVYYNIHGFKGSIGMISAIHGKFCDQCNRIRLTAKGLIKPCLCFGEGVNLMEVLRSDVKDKEKRIAELLALAIYQKPASHIFEKKDEITEEHNMIQIGG